MSTKISETFSKGMEHLKTGQDKVVEYVPPGLLKWSIFVLNFYFAAYSGYLLLFTRKTLIIGWKIHSGTPKYFSFFFLLLLSALMFVSFVIAIYAIFRKPSFIRAYFILIAVCCVLQVCMDVSFHIQKEKRVSEKVINSYLVRFRYLSPEEQDIIQTVQQKNKCCGSNSYLDYAREPHNLPSSCCGKYDRKEHGPEQAGGCSETELDQIPGCGNGFNKFFRAQIPKSNNPSQGRASVVLYPIALLIVSLAWIFSLQIIKRRENERARIAISEQNQNCQVVFIAEENTMASTSVTAMAGTSFR